MGKMYSIDDKKLLERPEIRVGDKVFAVDDRLSTFEKMNREMKKPEGKSEFAIIIGNALGEKNYAEIMQMDLSYAVMCKIVIMILAAVQDLTEEEAERRFRTGQGQ